MRTTVSIDDELLRAAKRGARQRGETLGQVVEAALRRELADPVDTRAVPVIPVFTARRTAAGHRPHLEPGAARGPRRRPRPRPPALSVLLILDVNVVVAASRDD